MGQTITNYDSTRGLTTVLEVCDNGNITKAEFIFDVPIPILSFRPEQLFAPRYNRPYNNVEVPERRIVNFEKPCSDCGNKEQVSNEVK